jgi:type II secretory pathway component PulF
MGCLMVIIFTVVFPKMLKLLTGLGAELPLPTKIMVALSGIVSKYFFLIAAAACIMYASFQFFKRTPHGRRIIDEMLLRLPVVGSLTRKINLSRYFKIIATLHASGLNVEKTFIIGAEVIGNTVLSEKLRSIADALITGDSISEAMRRTGYIQDLVVDMVSIAEKTGRLDDALNRASDILDKEVPETIKKIVALVEPLTMALLGGLVLLLLLSVFLPIYKTVGSIKVR